MAVITNLEALHTQIVVDGNECWIWQGPSNVVGYGVAANGTSGGTTAHRLACTLAHGPAPADRPYALHSCDVKLCCNPAHLRWGSAQENSADAGQRRDENAGYPRLTPALVREARAARESGETMRSLVKRLDVPYATLYQAVTRRTWKHVA